MWNDASNPYFVSFSIIQSFIEWYFPYISHLNPMFSEFNTPSFPTSSPEKNSTGTTLASGASVGPLGRGRWSRLARDRWFGPSSGCLLVILTMKNWGISIQNGDLNHEKWGFYHDKLGNWPSKSSKERSNHQKCGCHWLSTRRLMIDQINTKNYKLPSGNQTWLAGQQHVGRKIVQ